MGDRGTGPLTGPSSHIRKQAKDGVHLVYGCSNGHFQLDHERDFAARRRTAGGACFNGLRNAEGLMAGLKDKRGFIDKDRLDLSERQAVEYWMKRWGVTRDQLTTAHRKVGRMVNDIAAELGKKR